MAKHVTDANFAEEVLNSDMPVFVDFWATWCGPCKMLAPVIEEVSKNLEGKVKVVKLDVDANPETASRYGIMSIPSLLIFNGGKVVDQIVGAVPKKQMVERINKIVN